jgi:hypothetical protein
MAFEGFEDIRAEIDVHGNPLCTIEPTVDHQLVITCSVTESTPSTPPLPQPEVKNTRSKMVNPMRNTRSKKRNS